MLSLLAVLAGVASASDIVTFDDTSIHSIVDSPKPVFVKFFAPWCGHCKSLAPTWDLLATELKETVTVADVDCTQHKPLCSAFSVRGFPTLKLVVDGQVYDHKGARSQSELSAFAQDGYKSFEMSALPTLPSPPVAVDVRGITTGKYCGEASILTYRAQVTTFLSSNGMMDFRVDGDMHVAWCNGNAMDIAEDHTITFKLPLSACAHQVLQDKTGGEHPVLKFDPATKTVSMKIKGVLPILDYLGGELKLELSQENCEIMMGEEAVPHHSEL